MKVIIKYDYQGNAVVNYTGNDDKNNKLAEEYKKLSGKEDKVIFGGRLAEYKYYDMDDVIKSAMTLCENIEK